MHAFLFFIIHIYMGDYVWFAEIYDEKTIINDKNKTMTYLKKCTAICKENKMFYLLLNDKVIIINELIYKEFFTLDNTSNKICVDKKIFVSGEDSGAISIYNYDGQILNTIKIGEHISDFFVINDFIYAITYHDNFFIKTTDKMILKKVILNNFPEKIIKGKYIYILLNNAYYSFIKMFDFDLNLIKEIYFKRQIGDIFLYKNKIIFNGEDYNYILTENLTLISQKNSTGKFLCRFSDYPILETKERFGIINNIIYP